MSTSKFRTQEIVYCATFSSLMAACSWISIPTTVPFTMQTFAVFLTLMMLGGKLGSYAVVTYLLLGAVGVPVFAGMTGGLGVLFGMTGGYLLGFMAISFLYFLAVKNPMEKPVFDLTILVVGLFLCYMLGTIQFVMIYSQNVADIGVLSVLSMCVFPYIIPDLIKMGIAFALAKRLRPYVKVSQKIKVS